MGSVPPSAAVPACRTRTLFEDDAVRIDWTHRNPPSRALVLTFDPILLGADRPAFAQEFLRRLGVDQLAVRKKREHFYQPLARDDFLARMAPVLACYRRRVAYGSSLGAYAALYFCAGEVDAVVASSPRNSSHPRHGIERWQQAQPFLHRRFAANAAAGAGVTVFYDPLDPLDRPYVEGELRPAFPQADWRPLRLAGHPANHYLAEIGFIGPFVRSVVLDTPRPAPNPARRKTSPAWLRELAAHNTRRGRPRWGHALAQRSLALKPKQPAALRVLVEAELALGRPDAARAALERFRSTFPDTGDELATTEDLLAAPAAVPPSTTSRWPDTLRRRLRALLPATAAALPYFG